MKYYFLIILSIFIFCNCTPDEPFDSSGDAIQGSNGDIGEDENNVYLLFNRWVYQEMNRQYLWREDLPDSLNCDYSLAPKEFFNSLLSKRDRFSYLTFSSRSVTGSSDTNRLNGNNLGFSYQEVLDQYGNTALQILFINSDELKSYGFRRGDIVRIDNLNNKSYEIKKVLIHNNKIEELPGNYLITRSKINSNQSVLLDTIYRINGRDIGYLCYLEYEDKEDLDIPLRRFKSGRITDLILDLRYNPGGYVSTCKYLCNCIVPEIGYDKIFQQCSYNDILSTQYLRETGDAMKYNFFENPKDYIGEMLGSVVIPLNLKHLYVLTSSHTASASEATIICLRSYMPVTVIGEQTIGKGVGSWTISDSRFKYAIQPITMRYYNADGETVPDEGLVPDYYVPDGYSTSKRDLGDIREPLLAKALRLIVPSLPYDPFESNDYNADDFKLIPVGEPSFVSDFKERQIAEGYVE